jgi:chemotaxis signal transduction protein
MTATATDTLLIFRIAGIPFAVPAESVATIVMPPAHLTHPPGSGKSTPGIFEHGGQVHAVIDLHERFGIETPRRGSGRLLLQHDPLRHNAFWVDEVVGLVPSEQGQWANLPPYLPRSLFWSGFLHRQEIVLCTRLDTLRTMRDASPLHRHLEILQQTSAPATKETARREKSASGGATEVKGGQPGVAAPRAAQRPTPPPAPSPRRPSDPADKPTGATRSPQPVGRAVAKPAPLSARTTSTKTVAASGRQHDNNAALAPRTATPTVAAARRNPTVPRRQPSPPPSTIGTAATKPAPPALGQDRPMPAATPNSNRSPLLPWLLLTLLVGGVALTAWWLWPQPLPERSPVPALSAENRWQPPYPATPQPKTSETRSATAPPPPPPRQAAEPPRPAPVRIERDTGGTLNLIIDRGAIEAQRRSAQRQPVERAPADDMPQQRAPAEATDAQATNGVTAAVEAAETEPLQPEPHWPAPVPASVEPCDCIHIVMPGDTLWDIAERYTHNAFNYRELARLSGIRNPDLIYPGDRVHITIR